MKLKVKNIKGIIDFDNENGVKKGLAKKLEEFLKTDEENIKKIEEGIKKGIRYPLEYELKLPTEEITFNNGIKINNVDTVIGYTVHWDVVGNENYRSLDVRRSYILPRIEEILNNLNKEELKKLLNYVLDEYDRLNEIEEIDLAEEAWEVGEKYAEILGVENLLESNQHIKNLENYNEEQIKELKKFIKELEELGYDIGLTNIVLDQKGQEIIENQIEEQLYDLETYDEEEYEEFKNMSKWEQATELINTNLRRNIRNNKKFEEVLKSIPSVKKSILKLQKEYKNYLQEKERQKLKEEQELKNELENKLRENGINENLYLLNTNVLIATNGELDKNTLEKLKELVKRYSTVYQYWDNYSEVKEQEKINKAIEKELYSIGTPVIRFVPFQSNKKEKIYYYKPENGEKVKLVVGNEELEQKQEVNMGL